MSLVVVLAVVSVYPYQASRRLGSLYGPSTRQQIDYGFAFLEREARQGLIFLGNSRIYRGLEPTQFPGAAFNFGQDGDGPNQMYYKLQWLQERQKLPGVVVLGIDYFLFSNLDPARAEDYVDYFPESFLLDYSDHLRSQSARGRAWGEFQNQRWNRWLARRYPQSLEALLLRPPFAAKPTLTERGFYEVQARAAANARSPYLPVRRDIHRLDMQVDYFRRSLALCHQQRSRVILVMPPMNHYERQAYAAAEKRAWWRWMSGLSHDCLVLDFENSSEFRLNDFADFTHLTTSAAQRFSENLAGATRSFAP